jgi:hypothetical protein
MGNRIHHDQERALCIARLEDDGYEVLPSGTYATLIAKGVADERERLRAAVSKLPAKLNGALIRNFDPFDTGHPERHLIGRADVLALLSTPEGHDK